MRELCYSKVTLSVIDYSAWPTSLNLITKQDSSKCDLRSNMGDIVNVIREIDKRKLLALRLACVWNTTVAD